MPAVPRPASTVVVARPAGDGSYEILLTRRPASMAFMGGTYVFPGGGLEDADCADDMAERSSLSADEAAARLGESIPPSQALGLFCCGIRELYEEAGVLLATQGGQPVDPAKVREIYAPHHAEVGHDPKTFAAFLEREDLDLATDLLVPHGRLITPEQAPIRFDARFFVAPMPQGQAVSPHPTEVHEWLWITPGQALERARAGGRGGRGGLGGRGGPGGRGAKRSRRAEHGSPPEGKELDVPIPTMAILQGLAETPVYDQLMGGRHEQRTIETIELSPMVTVVRAPNPGLMSGAGTNTYIVGRGEVVIIDPAVPDPVYIERVAREAGNRGRCKLVLITHGHIDHIGGVVPLVEQMPVAVGAFESMGDPPFVTRTIGDGEVIEVGGAKIHALHTPGHASNHLCFYLEDEKALFAGDVVAGFGTVVISPPDGSLADYMSTLHRLAELDLGPIYAGHGPAIEDGAAKIKEYIEHRRERERQVIEALEAGLDEIPAMVKRIYAAVPEALHPMAERSVLAHLEMLETEGRVVRDGEGWKLT